MPAKKQFQCAIRNDLQAGGTLELYFLDYIGDSFNWDDWTITNLVQDVINKVNAAKPSKIVAYINSEGGSCDIGLAIYSYLKYVNAEIETRTLAMAGSIASVIAQAASPGKRYIAKTGFMAIHKAWGTGMGNSEDLRSAADVIDGYTDTIVGVYADVTGKDKKAIAKLIEGGDYWMNGEQAVEQGFADATFDEIPDGFDILNAMQDLDEHYVNVPATLKKVHSKNSDTMTWKERMAAFTNSFKNKVIDPKASNLAEEICNHMAEPMEELLKGMDDDFSERLVAQKEEITKSIQDAMKTDIEGATTANNDLQKKLDDLTEQNKKLVNELSELKGGSTGSDPAATNGVTPIGYGVKAKASAN